ncbi:MAG: chemotaxis protein CheX [Bryobacteraceae bacterium]|nr:chemotaxis protein CheX [Bryobacteraceae bacterium]
MQQEELVRFILESTESVFSTMLGLEVQAGEPRTSQGAVGPSYGVAALVGLAGSWVGTGSVDCSAELACKMAGAMLGSEYETVNDDVLDAMGEVANMIVGNIKNNVESLVGPMDLSIPTVVYGRNFTTRTQRHNQWTVVPFQCDNDEFLIQVMLLPNNGQSLPVCVPVGQAMEVA